ncbi:hypothetical protein [Parvularcula sp. LCG005]|uniref:hypothetical protein n=1 Tax=Parvularcula sp. LCG005 TaxID=3078805 RepID=UPI002943E34F|nr:hypothetical protein [Parvularcula sp. LCG005]WOI52581.1 hypothetical protein RUI03_10525 [Parvularcula sp. LCG005]
MTKSLADPDFSNLTHWSQKKTYLLQCPDGVARTFTLTRKEWSYFYYLKHHGLLTMHCLMDAAVETARTAQPEYFEPALRWAFREFLLELFEHQVALTDASIREEAYFQHRPLD